MIRRYAKALITFAVLLTAVVWTSSAADLPPVDQKKVCTSCHDEISNAMAQPNVHKPVTEGKCSACHNPHASRHEALLADNEEALCERCHSEAGQWTHAPVVHAPVAEGKCVVCHDPHGSKQFALLKAPRRDLCETCHSEVKDWAARPVQHDPVKRGQCGVCHSPHAGSEPGLLKASQATVCLKCHQITPHFTEVHKGFDPTSAKCSACHDPHGGSTQTLVMKDVHPPFGEGNCSACHAEPKPGGGYPLKAPAIKVCGECHDAEAATVTRFHAHGSNEVASCERCHNAHASDTKPLLASAQQVLCRKCHVAPKAETTTADPHAKLSCTSCHAAHGSENKYYFSGPDMEVCATCHKNEHHVSHPMGADVKDKISGNPVTCTSCHLLHGWKADPLLVADGQRDLCVRCHNK